jgi:Rrf2 family protein
MYLMKKNTEYALKALYNLYGSSPELKTLNTISDEMNIPKYLLRRLMQSLGRAKIVKAANGVNGGYSLLQKFYHITLYELIVLLQGEVTINKCFMNNDCKSQTFCPIKGRLSQIQNDLIETLSSVTVLDLAKLFNTGRKNDFLKLKQGAKSE